MFAQKGIFTRPELAFELIKRICPPFGSSVDGSFVQRESYFAVSGSSKHKTHHCKTNVNLNHKVYAAMFIWCTSPVDVWNSFFCLDIHLAGVAK